MRLLDYYVAKTVLFTIVLVATVLLGLDLLFAFIDQLEDLEQQYQIPQALNYVFLTAPSRFYDMLSVSVLIGCLIGLGALASNSELVVMRTAGLSVYRIILSTLIPVFGFLAAGLALGQYVVPFTEQVAQSQKALHLGGGKVMRIKRGNWQREGNDFIHIAAIEPNGAMHGITRYHFDEEFNIVSTSFARRAIYQGDYWHVEDKKITTFTDQGLVTSEEETGRWDSKLTPKLLTLAVLEPGHLSITELYQYAKYLKAQGLSYLSYELAFWQKVIHPIVTVVMVLIAASFVFGPLRSVTVGLRVMVGLVVGLIFIYLQEFVGQFSLVFELSPLFGAMLPVVLFGVAGVYLIQRAR